MREDMRHVVIDRPRIGGYAQGLNGGRADEGKGYKRALHRMWNPKQNPEDYEEHYNELPLKDGSRKRRYQNFKMQSDHLGPLWRYLRSNVGRLWNDVFSEICANIRLDSTLQRHVREHIDLAVEQDVKIVGGKVYHNHGYKLQDRFNETFYVHPETGILCETSRKRHVREDKKDYIQDKKDENKQYHLINECWFEVKLADCPEHEMVYNFWEKRSYERLTLKDDALLGKHSTFHARWQKYGAGTKYAVSKRQLNRREVKRLGLSALVA